MNVATIMNLFEGDKELSHEVSDHRLCKITCLLNLAQQLAFLGQLKYDVVGVFWLVLRILLIIITIGGINYFDHTSDVSKIFKGINLLHDFLSNIFIDNFYCNQLTCGCI